MPIDVLKGMNPQQRIAVAHMTGPLLVVAGAGSGKTRVITHRIANIIQEAGIRPDNILAITFTNKAAGEMAERVEHLLGIQTPWICTFHSAGLRILKLEMQYLGFEHPFTILDAEDQKRTMRRAMVALEIDPKEYDPRGFLEQISSWKNQLLRPEDVAQAHPDGNDMGIQVYQKYWDLCTDECVLDFDDLLLRPVLLLQQHREIQQKYLEKFPYVLIDEYQDTNAAQYAFIRLLGEHGNVCATGDPDQAIYEWRGADITNILQFEQDYPQCTSVLLEENYRSTKTILRAAQKVVEHNKKRKDKKIFTNNTDGKKIRLVTVDDQDDEAMAVAAAVDRMRTDGIRPGDIAIFYRTNGQSRALEEWLIRRGIPYRIVGGTRFYDRKEVKDLLAYLKLLINPRDRAGLTRIINVPRRGIGDRTLQTCKDVAFEEGVALFEIFLQDELLDRVAVGRSERPLREFSLLLRRLRELEQDHAAQCVREVLQQTGLEDFYLEQDDDQSEERLMNIREVLTAAEQFCEAHENCGLEAFLDHVALITSVDTMRKGEQEEQQVVLMTLHASKGLEFPVVFITGMEQGVLPLVRNGFSNYEEERRLMYVGITRAKEELYLSRAVTRTQFGKTVRNPPSMFLAEIPDDCIEHFGRQRRPHRQVEAHAGPQYPQSSLASSLAGTNTKNAEGVTDALASAGLLMNGAALKAALATQGSDPGVRSLRKQEGEQSSQEPVVLPADPYAPGALVTHESFGDGRVVKCVGPQDDRRIIIDFAHIGEKELLLAFAAERLHNLE